MLLANAFREPCCLVREAPAAASESGKSGMRKYFNTVAVATIGRALGSSGEYP